MTPYAQSTQRAQIARCASLARRALAAHGLEAVRLKNVGHGENTTFRATTPRGVFLARVHRRGYHSTAAIEAELTFLEALAASDGPTAPVPLRTPGVPAVQTLDGRGMDGPRDVTLFHWMPGRIVGSKGAGAATYRALGALTAQLHVFAREWDAPTPFPRQVFTPGSGYFAADQVTPLAEIPWIEPAERAALEARRQHAAEIARALEGDGAARIPMHADLHLFNVLHSDGRMVAIDFDDMQVAHPIVDFAVPLGSVPVAMHQPYFEGYRSVAELPDAWVQALPAYVLFRRVVMLEWLDERSQAMPWLADYYERVLAHARLAVRWFDGDASGLDGVLSLFPTADS